MAEGKRRLPPSTCRGTRGAIQKEIPMILLSEILTSLRPYQLLAYQFVLQRIQEGCTRLYVSLPTGTGKSHILTAVAAQRGMQGRALVLIHLQDLVIQLTQALKQVGLDVGMVMQGYRQIDHLILVTTPQSLLTAWSDCLEASEVPITTVLIDEAHHAVPDSLYEQILAQLQTSYPQESIAAVGFTATPYRSDTKSMLSFLPTCAFIREIPEMMKEGWLAPLTWVPLCLDVDFSTLPTTTQEGVCEYSERELTQMLVQTALMEELVRQVVPHLEQRPTLVFAMSVKHAEQLATLFSQAGHQAVVVSAHTHRIQREHIYDQWRAGSIQIVSNCRLLTEGFDFPGIAALVIARPTRSPGFYLQMIGRGTRKAPGKQDCLVIDLMGNTPDLSHQVVLPHILREGLQDKNHVLVGEKPPPSHASDSWVKQIMGAHVHTGLSFLDPLGASSYRWNAYQSSYFTMVSSDTAAILERDPNGSGLYHSRLYTRRRGQEALHQWIEKTYLPLQQQVALIHDATSTLYRETLGSKDAPWLQEPVSDKQVATLKRLSPKLAERARVELWTKGKASHAITLCLLFRTLRNPPKSDLI
jgi:superfamily II DNA or RNA helicase